MRNRNPNVSVLLTKPKDLDYEFFIFTKYLGLIRHILAQKERRTGTLEEDLELLKQSSDELGYMKRMATVYRCEKKKILRTNIDLCHYVIGIIMRLRDQGDGMTAQQYQDIVMDETEVERKGLFSKWVMNADS